jgi:hypothetical protein
MDQDEIRTNLKIATGAESPREGLSMSVALARLDAISREKTLPRDLAHYLSRRSYVKALEWLDHPDMPHQL